MLLEGAPALSSFEVPILAKKLFIDLKITRVIEGGGGRIGREREAAGGRLFFFFWGGGSEGVVSAGRSTRPIGVDLLSFGCLSENSTLITRTAHFQKKLLFFPFIEQHSSRSIPQL